MITILSSIITETVVPIGICVVMPCLIVFLVMWKRKNDMNRKTELAIKAIENGAVIDPNFFETKPKTTYKGMIFRLLKSGIISLFLGAALIITRYLTNETDVGTLNMLITCGLVATSIGAALLITFFIARKHFTAELKAEEEKLSKEE